MNDLGAVPRLPSHREVTFDESGSSPKVDRERDVSIAFVSFAISTGRQLGTNKDLSKTVSLARVCLEMYVRCARMVHADQMALRHGTEQNDLPPQVKRLVDWAQKAKEEELPRVLAEVIKPKIADILIFYIGAHDYSDDEILAFVEGISEILTSPPSSAVKHDWANSKVFSNLVQKFGHEELRSNRTTGKDSLVGMSLWKAVQANLVSAPCVAIQRCHSLYPTQLSSPMTPLRPSSNNEPSPAGNVRYGDLSYFADNATRACFSSVFPLLLSLVRLDELQHELEAMWKGDEDRAASPSYQSSADVSLALRRWTRINKVAEAYERIWRKTSIFVDFVDPDIRKISEINQKHTRHCTTAVTAEKSSSVSIRTAGLRAVKRERSPSGKLHEKSEYVDIIGDREQGFECTGPMLLNRSWRSLAACAHCELVTASSRDGLVSLPRDVLRHISTFLTPRCLAAFVYTSKCIAKSLLPLDASPESYSLVDIYIVRSLQLSRNASRLLKQCAEQTWAERFTYMCDPQMAVVRSTNPQPQQNRNAGAYGQAPQSIASLLDLISCFDKMRRNFLVCE